MTLRTARWSSARGTRAAASTCWLEAGSRPTSGSQTEASPSSRCTTARGATLASWPCFSTAALGGPRCVRRARRPCCRSRGPTSTTPSSRCGSRCCAALPCALPTKRCGGRRRSRMRGPWRLSRGSLAWAASSDSSCCSSSSTLPWGPPSTPGTASRSSRRPRRLQASTTRLRQASRSASASCTREGRGRPSSPPPSSSARLRLWPMPSAPSRPTSWRARGPSCQAAKAQRS
mmetsp:Transcript_104605/g.312451  ORF Transcript_104605/g.312451 Transcript_104605/m.312451 type:complete len:232 (-) Transcript_104605:592-1287(-)